MPTFKFRHTEAEKEAWQARANDAGMSLSAWIKSQLNGLAPMPVATVPTKPVPTPKRAVTTTPRRPNDHAANCRCLACRGE